MTEKLLNILLGVLIFLLGFFSAAYVSPYLLSGDFSFGLEEPLSFLGFGSFIGNVSPSDFIGRGDILVYDDMVVIKVDGASIGRYADTGSMRPVLDKGTNGIRVRPESEDDIHVGDIVTFREGDGLIIHRVIEKGFDKEGVYFVTKGDNNNVSDGKVRFSEIEYLTIGLIY